MKAGDIAATLVQFWIIQNMSVKTNFVSTFDITFIHILILFLYLSGIISYDITTMIHIFFQNTDDFILMNNSDVKNVTKYRRVSVKKIPN